MTQTAVTTKSSLRKGDRVILSSLAGEEGATVESLSTPSHGETVWATLKMDDRTRYSCPVTDLRRG